MVHFEIDEFIYIHFCVLLITTVQPDDEIVTSIRDPAVRLLLTGVQRLLWISSLS